MRITGLALGAFIFISVSFFGQNAALHADTVIKGDGEELRGVVVEDYNDRVILSTMEGEKEIMKNSIKNIIFDMEVQNLTSLADFYQDRKMYDRAYYYYSKALAIDPDYKKAREGLHYAGTHMQHTDRIRKIDHIQRLNEENLWQKGIPPEREHSAEQQLRDILGIGIKSSGGFFKISDVISRSPAARAGIKKGDILLEAWGRAVSYMQPEEVIKKLLSPGIMDVQVTIARFYMLDLEDRSGNYSNLIGVKLDYSEMEGLMVKKVKEQGVAAASGIKEGDIILEVQGESSRYMPLKTVGRLINSRKGDTLSLKIKRDVVIWKKIKNGKRR